MQRYFTDNQSLRFAPAIVSGILFGGAFPSVGIHILAWIALTPLLADAAKRTSLQSALRFTIAGWIFHMIVLHWLAGNVHWAGGYALIGWAGLSLYMAVYWGVIGAMWPWMNRIAPWPIAALWFAGLWAGMEYLQATLFTGFGWSATAYSQGANLAIAQLASIGGIGLVAGIVALANACIASAIIVNKRRWMPITFAVVLVAVAILGGRALHRTPAMSENAMRVGIVQSNYPQRMKWDPSYTVAMVQQTAEISQQIAERLGADVIVWPEALIMRDPVRDPEIEPIVRRLAQESDVHLLIGSGRSDRETGGDYNACFHVKPDGIFSEEQVYDKTHLAPFGEYIPLESWIPLLRDYVPAIGDVEAGEEYAVFDVDGTMIAPLICFEVLFPSMTMHARSIGADAIVVVTNLGWFGAPSVHGQELEMARFRAIESRLPVIHAANTGISGVMDPFGNFQGVDAWVSQYGGIRQALDMKPEETINLRMIGAFQLPAKANQPFAIGPVWFSPVVLVAVMVGTVVAAIRSRRRNISEHALTS